VGIKSGGGPCCPPEVSNCGILAPFGLTYRPFQREGIEWMAARSRMLLADDMGL
jgi:hypothetical protein